MGKVTSAFRTGVQTAGEFVQSLSLIGRYRQHFASINTYCMFVGYPRSGHTLVGSLLDAHPNAIIALELDALRCVKFGFSRSQIFSLIIANSDHYARAGRVWTGYDYTVPGQWQGRFDGLSVIGDKRGGESSRRLIGNPQLLDKLATRVQLPIKVIHVIRNPLDNIASMVARGDAPTVDEAVKKYFRLANAAGYVKSRTDVCSVYDVWSEAFVRNPANQLEKLCAFLGLSTPTDYVNACSSIVFDSPRITRQNITFSPKQLASIRGAAANYAHLKAYALDVPEAISPERGIEEGTRSSA